MPTIQEIENLHQTMMTQAQTIQSRAVAAAAKAAAHLAKKTEKEIKKAAMVAEVANARFEVNNKLQYTNDDQRTSAVIEMQQDSVEWQIVETEEKTLAQEKAAADAETEMERKTFRANELLMLYYANHPAA